MMKDFKIGIEGMTFEIVEELPDVINKIYLLHKKEPLKDGSGEIDVYEEWFFTRELIGYIEPDDEAEE